MKERRQECVGKENRSLEDEQRQRQGYHTHKQLGIAGWSTEVYAWACEHTCTHTQSVSMPYKCVQLQYLCSAIRNSHFKYTILKKKLASQSLPRAYNLKVKKYSVCVLVFSLPKWEMHFLSVHPLRDKIQWYVAQFTFLLSDFMPSHVCLSFTKGKTKLPQIS